MSVVELAVGVRLWLDGEVWTVQSLSTRAATLRATHGRVRVIDLSVLVSQVVVLSEAGDDEQVTEDRALLGVLLTSLSRAQLAVLEERARHVRALLAPEFDGPPLAARYAAKASELGVSVRTLKRWAAGYRDAGVAGLADARLLSPRTVAVDARWDAACLQVLDALVPASTPTMSVVLSRVARELVAAHGVGTVPLPSRSSGYLRLTQLAKGRHAFGSAKGRRSVAERPQGVYGRLRASRPGEYVVLDTTPLDVFAMEPVTLRWLPVELTVAMDLYTRCILGLRLTPLSTTAQDVASVLFQCVTPQATTGAAARGDGGEHRVPGWQAWPFHGVPRNLLVGTEVPDGVSQQRVGGLPACLPEAIVVDHGRQYLSSHVLGVCARLGITVQPAIPYKPTDKPTVERFFRTLRESLLQHLPAYKGPDVYSRGKDIEQQAFFYLPELEQVIREWVGTVYHHTKHTGLCVPQLPAERFSPAEMFEVGLATAGALRVPARPELVYDFLAVAWRTIQHYGVEIHGQRYNGPGLNAHRGRRSPHGGVYAGKWPFHVDAADVRQVFFQDPETKAWHTLQWEHAHGLAAPLSQDAADYAKKISVRTARHIDPEQAVQDLLGQWSRGEVETRRDRALARRLSAQRAVEAGPADGSAKDGQPRSEQDVAREVASLPGVIDLLEERGKRDRSLEVVDDVDVFERYYAEHPDAVGFEVFEE